MWAVLVHGVVPPASHTQWSLLVLVWVWGTRAMAQRPLSTLTSPAADVAGNEDLLSQHFSAPPKFKMFFALDSSSGEEEEELQSE